MLWGKYDLTMAFMSCSLLNMATDKYLINDFSAQEIIGIPITESWNYLRDLSLAHNYVPGVIDTCVTTEKKEGVGTSRRVYQGKAKYINETVEEWNEGKGFLIRLHREGDGPPFPFKEAWFRYSIESDDQDFTRLTVNLIYVMRWGKFGKILNKLLIGKFIGDRIRSIAKRIKIYYETGERVTPELMKHRKRTN